MTLGSTIKQEDKDQSPSKAALRTQNKTSPHHVSKEVAKKKRFINRSSIEYMDPVQFRGPNVSWQRGSDQMTLCIDKLDPNAKLGFDKVDSKMLK